MSLAGLEPARPLLRRQMLCPSELQARQVFVEAMERFELSAARLRVECSCLFELHRLKKNVAGA